MQFVKSLWAKLDGKKTLIGAILVIVLARLKDRGIEIDPIFLDIADALFGFGLAHKAVKTVPLGSKPTSAAALVGIGLFLMGLGACLPGCATAAQPTDIRQPQKVETGQETKANEVYMAVAGFRSRAKTHTGSLGYDEENGAAGERTLDVPMLDENGKPVLDENGKPVLVKVAGRIGDVYIVFGGLDAHQEIQVPGTSTATQSASAGKNDTSNKQDSASPTNDVKPDIKVPAPGAPLPSVPDVPPPPAPPGGTTLGGTTNSGRSTVVSRSDGATTYSRTIDHGRRI